MKTFVNLSVTLLLLLNTGCEKSTVQKGVSAPQDACLKGIVVKKGICGQFVIKVLSEAKDGVKYAGSWKDESSGKTFTNVFTVENYCTFPGTLNEGDEFKFKLTTVKDSNCAVCQAFTPVPNEKNSIIVSNDCTSVKN